MKNCDIVRALEERGLKISRPSLHPDSHRCSGCMFEGEYRDMGACTPLCNREDDFVNALKAHSNSGPCKWYITKSQVKELQDILLKGEKIC